MTSTNQPDAENAGKIQSGRPLVPFVRILDSDNLSECPFDHNFLTQLPADLAYSRDSRGGSVVTCPLTLRYCSVCGKWFVDPQRLISLAKQGINLRGFDILGSEAHPRPEAYKTWHPEATAVPVVQSAAPTTSRKPAPDRQRSKASGVVRMTDKNLAFRCRFCDGGQAGRSLGFRGVCSQACYFQNVVESRDIWCSDPANLCQIQKPDDSADVGSRCCESHLLTDWVCGPKTSHADAPATPVHISGNRTGSIALATTVLPRESEANRRIFAIFLIASQEDINGQTYVTADPRLRLELMNDETLYFWKFFQGKGKADELRWDYEPYRNISQDTVIRILSKALRVIKDSDRRAIAEMLFNRFSSTVSPEHLKRLLS